MRTARAAALLVPCLTICLALPAWAADRVRAGQWETMLTVAGQAITRSVCISQSDADTINGDANSLKAYVDKVNAPAGCKVTDVTITGNQVKVTSVCANGKENVGTTSYHGDSSETVNTNGAKSESDHVRFVHSRTTCSAPSPGAKVAGLQDDTP